jgi:hypothetical protein
MLFDTSMMTSNRPAELDVGGDPAVASNASGSSESALLVAIAKLVSSNARVYVPPVTNAMPAS